MLRRDLPGDTVVSTMLMPVSVSSLNSWVRACEVNYGADLTFNQFEDEQGARWLQIRTPE